MAVAILSACRDAGRDAGLNVIRRDSTGIEIVETVRPRWDGGGGWTIDATPSLVIGQLDGDLPFLFGELRGALRLDDGNIVALDNQARELRWFTPSGDFVRSAGGPGGGPGEFSHSAYQLERCGKDRIYVHDRGGLRVHVWDTAGSFQRGFPLVEPTKTSNGPYRYACRDDGGLIAVGWGEPLSPPIAPGREAFTYRQHAPVWALDSLGALEVELGTYLSSERIRMQTASAPHPFGRAVSFAAGNGKVVIGTGEDLAVLIYNTDNFIAQRSGSGAIPAPKPVAIWRAKVDDTSFDGTARQQYADAQLGGTGKRFRALILDGVIEMPPSLPAYVDLRVSRDGSLWVKRFRSPWDTIERWGVFAPDGVFLGNIAFPERFQLTDIGQDYVLGIAADSLDVQRVNAYRIRK